MLPAERVRTSVLAKYREVSDRELPLPFAAQSDPAAGRKRDLKPEHRTMIEELAGEAGQCRRLLKDEAAKTPKPPRRGRAALQSRRRYGGASSPRAPCAS